MQSQAYFRISETHPGDPRLVKLARQFGATNQEDHLGQTLCDLIRPYVVFAIFVLLLLRLFRRFSLGKSHNGISSIISSILANLNCLYRPWNSQGPSTQPRLFLGIIDYAANRCSGKSEAIDKYIIQSTSIQYVDEWKYGKINAMWLEKFIRDCVRKTADTTRLLVNRRRIEVGGKNLNSIMILWYNCPRGIWGHKGSRLSRPSKHVC